MELKYNDYQLIVVAACLREAPEASVICASGIVYVDTNSGLMPDIDVLSLSKVSASWSETVRQAERICNSPDFAFQKETGDMSLVIDNTQGSEQVRDQVLGLETDSTCVELTLSETDYNKWKFRDVAGSLIAAYQGGRIEIAGGIELAEALEASLGTVTVRDAENTDALPLSLGLVAYEAGRAIPADTYDRGSGYDTANWGL